MRADPEASVERVVAEMCTDLQPGHPVPGPDAILADLGFDSLALADLALAVEERYGVRLADGVTRLRTVGDIAELVRRAEPGERRLPRGMGTLQGAALKASGWAIRRYARLEVRGTEHVPTSGPAVMAANHRSMLDIPVHVLGSPRPIWFMAKSELFRLPLAHPLWHLLGGFAVRRRLPDLRAIDVGLAVLEGGGLLGIYPEGRRSRDGRMLPFLRGAAWFALRTGAPVVPCGIRGTARHERKRDRAVRVAFGPPLPVEREDDPLARRRKAEALTSDLLASIDALVA